MAISRENEAQSQHYALLLSNDFKSSHGAQHFTLQAFEQFGALYISICTSSMTISDPAGIRTQYRWISSYSRIKWAIGAGLVWSKQI